MKHTRLIEIKKLELTLYSFSEEKEIVKHLPDLNYSNVGGLCYDCQTAGIALRIYFNNKQSLFRRPQGVRRPVQLMVTDTTINKEVFVKDLNLNISKNDYLYLFHTYIPLKEFPFDVSHSYTLSFIDCIKGLG